MIKKILNSKLSILSGKSEAGFTLIELILVIGIIGVLVSATLIFIDPKAQIDKSRDARRKSDLGQIQKALEEFYQDNGNYPSSSANYQIVDSLGNPVGWNTRWDPYMGLVPKDPNSGKNYVYFSNGQAYYLYASLDRGTKDQQACKGAQGCNSLTTIGIGSQACGSAEGATCDYVITSPNVSGD